MIPANTFSVSQSFDFVSRIQLTNAVNATITIRHYLNTSAALLGGTLIATAPLPSGQLFTLTKKNVFIKASTETVMLGAARGYTHDFQVDSVASSNVNINWTVNQYLIIAIQNGSISQITKHFCTHIYPIG